MLKNQVTLSSSNSPTVEAAFVLDLKAVIISVSQTGASLLNKEPGALLGKNFWELFPDRKFKSLYNAFLKVLEGHDHVVIEEYSETEHRWDEYHLHITGNAIRFFYRNITQLKSGQQKPSSQDSLYKTFFENNLDGVLLGFPDGRIYAANPAACAIFLRTEEEICTLGREGLMDFSDPLLASMLKQRELTGNTEGEIPCIRGDGTMIMLGVKSHIFKDDSGIVRTVAIFRDNTKLHEAESKLHTYEELTRTIYEQVPVGIAVIDSSTGNFMEVNQAFSDISGYAVEELRHKCWRDIILPDNFKEEFPKKKKKTTSDFPGFQMVKHYKRPDQEMVWINMTIAPMKVSPGATPRHFCMIEDITSRKHAEEKLNMALLEAERFRQIMDLIPTHVFIKDASARYIYANQSAIKFFGADPAGVAGKRVEHFFDPEIAEQVSRIDKEVLGGVAKSHELIIPGEDKKSRIFLEVKAPVYEGTDPEKIIGLIGISTDITENREAEMKQHEALETIRKIASRIPGVIYQYRLKPDGTACFPYSSDAIREIYRVTPEEVLTSSEKVNAILHPDDVDEIMETIRYSATHLTPWQHQYRVKFPDGVVRTLYGNSIPEKEEDGSVLWHGFITDITDLKKNEEELRLINRLYHFISQMNQMILRTREEDKLLSETCRIAVDYGHFKMAWLAKADESSDQIHPVVIAGAEEGYFREIGKISQLDIPEGRGPSGTAMREGRIVVSNDVATDVSMKLWRESALKRGFLSAIALPVKKFGKTYGIFTLYATVAHYFNQEEVSLLEHVTDDLSFALESIETEKMLGVAEKKSRDYAFALDQSSIIDISDENAVIRYVNDNFTRISGYTLDEIRGHDHNILNSGYHPKAFFGELWKTVMAGKVFKSEVRNKAKDGSFFWVDTTIVPFLDNAGKPIQFIAIRSDITKRKEAEVAMAEVLDRYNILTRATRDTIWDWDIVYEKVTYNEGINRTFGYDLMTSTTTNEWWDTKIHPSDKYAIDEAVFRAFSEKKDTIELTYRFLCADGTYKHILDRAFIIYDQKGEPVRMIGSMQDMTSEKEMNLQIEKEVINAQERERMQIGMELHDNVNQILAAALIYMGFGKENAGHGKNATEAILQGEEYIQSAISDIRRLSHQLAPVSSEEISQKELFNALLKTFRIKEGLKVKMSVAEPEGINLSESIKLGLYRILQEQLNNVLKHADASEITIDLSYHEAVLRLEIRDNGKGFDTGVRSKGIGLENIRRRAVALGGNCIIKSAAGKGCTLTVELPLPQ